MRHRGTNEWIHSDPKFRTWMSSTASACLPCYGIPGSGKSVLAASIIDDVGALLDAQSIMCYYHCDFAELDSLDPHYIVSCLNKQALVKLPLEQFDENFSCLFGEGVPIPTLADSREFFVEDLGNFKTVFIVIDGIDELDRDGQHTIVDLITDLLRPSTYLVKIFVTSRPEEFFVKISLRSHTHIDLSVTRIDEDIDVFIRDMIDTRVAKQNPLLLNEVLRSEVVNALLQGAQGM